jgi:hypothetical protein
LKKEQELQRDIANAERARQLLNDPMVVKALDSMRETVYSNIRSSHWKDKEEREALYLQLKAIDAFEAEFRRNIDAGKKAVTILEKLTQKMVGI